MKVLQRLVDAGNSVVVHRAQHRHHAEADWIIDWVRKGWSAAAESSPRYAGCDNSQAQSKATTQRILGGFLAGARRLMPGRTANLRKSK